MRISTPLCGPAIRRSDTLRAYFVWTGDPSHIPDHQNFLLRTSLSATAGVSFGTGGATSGLSATGEGMLEGDTVTATAGDAGNDHPAPHTKAVLVRATPTGNLITLSRSAGVSVDTSNSLPYATWVDSPALANASGPGTYYYIGPPSNGQTSATASANASATANTDSREVTISSDVETSYSKGAMDAQHPTGQWPHARNADGSMDVDAGVVPNTGITGGGGYHADVTYTANPVNFLNAGDPFGNYKWTHPGGSAGENQTPADKSITVHYDFGAPSGPAPLGSSATTTVSVFDSDGASGDATYTVHWHYPYENWAKNGNRYELTPLKYTSDGLSEAANGTYHVTVPSNSIDYSIPGKIVGGIGTVGAAVFAPYLDPLSVFFLISVGYSASLVESPGGNDLPCLGNASQLSKDVNIQEQINQTGTSNAFMPTTSRMTNQLANLIYQSGDYNGYVSGGYGPPGLYFSVTVYQHKWHQDYIGDAYDGHGYTGQAPGYVNWTGGYEYVYSWTLGQ